MLDAIIDVSHYDGEVDLAGARDNGILAVIHKATQGSTLVDPAYESNRGKAREAGLLWGAYHFALPGRGAPQADNFLDTAGPSPETLIALDLESSRIGCGMTLPEARSFVTRIFDRLGRWPGLSGGPYLKELLGDSRDPVLENCWLWLSHFGDHPVPPLAWPRWTLWQYARGRSRFDGDEEALRAHWRVPARAFSENQNRAGRRGVAPRG